MTSYDDDYPTCQQTYAVLRIFSDSIPPQEISALLDVSPTDSFAKGDSIGSGGSKRKHNGWFLSTETKIRSRDSRRHLDWLVDAVRDHEDALNGLRLAGAEIDISCYWVSIGQGGPTMGSEQMGRLSRLGLDVWWDIYFDTTSVAVEGKAGTHHD